MYVFMCYAGAGSGNVMYGVRSMRRNAQRIAIMAQQKTGELIDEWEEIEMAHKLKLFQDVSTSCA